MEIKEAITGILVGGVVVLIWVFIFRYYAATTSYIGMAILPAIIIGIVLFAVSFVLSIVGYRMYKKKNK